jgi:hypothetical protein
VSYSSASGAFAGIAVVLVPFDFPGIGSSSAFRIWTLGDLGNGFEDRMVKTFRGKKPPGSLLAGG